MSVCPGCGLDLPGAREGAGSAYRASPECLELYGEVIAFGMAHPAELGRWHQTCTDAYRLQHLAPSTKPITTAFALNALYLVFERGFTGVQAREAHGYLADTVAAWPEFERAPSVGAVTVFDVAMAGTVAEHADRVQEWGRSVWAAWSHVHADVAAMTDRQLDGWRPTA
ncbi:DUF5946 family protein [Actinomadura rayongensis]|uniref:Serine/threonine protein kinase n=1 Tax=Actinomadura rayongensis TaxID=1429076 RepID=A0A6I4W3J9_9ACTN|nr:DUF5946 family protein [Actinomadura rayongensis]MXQ63988.1 serine/threonine protein kinase [Actinomadura rayongensis]